MKTTAKTEVLAKQQGGVAPPHSDEDLERSLLVGLGVEARPYQRRMAAKAVRMFCGEHRNRAGALEPAAGSVMIESPTGSGKTVMGLTIARWLQQYHGLRVGWVAMRRNLLSQAAAENERWGFNVDLRLISMFDKSPPKVDLLIVDEAQHDAAQSMANLHSAIQPRKILGLSATPYRSDKVKLCFDKVIADTGIGRLIQDGYLSQYHHYTIPTYSPETVAERYLAEPDRWGKTLIFFHRLDQCQQCFQLLAQAGVKAEIVTASTDRQRQLDDFVCGRVNVLLNMAILTEGFDCPDLKTVFCRPSTKGCTIQMAGRAFRKHKDLPYKQVIQCQKTPHPMMKTATPREQYVWQGDGWKTLKRNQHLDSISQAALRLIAAADVELPQLVARNRSRPMPWQR